MLTFNLYTYSFFLMVLITLSGGTSNPSCNCIYQKLPNSNFVHSCLNLSVPLLNTTTTSLPRLLPHKTSLCSPNQTQRTLLWPWRSDFHIQKETRKLVCQANEYNWFSSTVPHSFPEQEGMTSFMSDLVFVEWLVTTELFTVWRGSDFAFVSANLLCFYCSQYIQYVHF